VTAAFNARPFGMIVAPNWIGLAAVGLLGLVEPGVWVLGAGVELGYLLLLAGNERFRRVVDAQRGATVSPHDELTGRIARGLLTLDPRERARYQAVAERCQSIIELQIAHAPGVVGVEAQQEGLSRLTWMYLRLLLARQAIERVHRDIASTRDLPGTLARLEPIPEFSRSGPQRYTSSVASSSRALSSGGPYHVFPTYCCRELRRASAYRLRLRRP
jgi:hypothetical protein